MKVYKSKSGYFYKQYKNGEKKRISENEYKNGEKKRISEKEYKKKISKNMKGGVLSKSETLELINKLDICSINDISIEYNGIDEIKYRFIEVPQGHIYKYDGNNVIDLGTNQIIASYDNIILYIMGMGPCRGLIIYETDRILMGHLDSIGEGSPLTLQTIDESLSGDKEKINSIYYVMGMTSYDCTLKEECSLCDISTEVLDIIQHKKLEEYLCTVNDFAYQTFTSKFGYNWQMDEFITFPIHPTIKNRFITKYEKEYEKWEEWEECENIKNKLIRKRKNSKKYKNSKSKCMSCNFKIKSRGKGKFLCSEFE